MGRDAVVGVALLACGLLGLWGAPRARAETPKEDPVEAEMLKDLDLLRELNLAQHRELLGRMSLWERLRLLERLRYLEEPTPPGTTEKEGR